MTMFFLIAAGILPWVLIADGIWGDDDTEDHADTPTDVTDPTEPIYPTDETDPTDPTDETDPTDLTNPTDETDPTEPVFSGDDDTAMINHSGGTYDALGGDDSIIVEIDPLDRGITNLGGTTSVAGGEGNDSLTSSAPIYDGPGATGHSYWGGSDSPTFVGSHRFVVLDGGAGDDTLTSLIQDDWLLGGEGNDLLIARSDQNYTHEFVDYSVRIVTNIICRGSYLGGGAGDDTLMGNMSDTLSGGDGADVFSLGEINQTVLNYRLLENTGYGYVYDPAVISDFTVGVDRLEFSDEFLADLQQINPDGRFYLGLRETDEGDTMITLRAGAGDHFPDDGLIADYIVLRGVTGVTFADLGLDVPSWQDDLTVAPWEEVDPADIPATGGEPESVDYLGEGSVSVRFVNDTDQVIETSWGDDSLATGGGDDEISAGHGNDTIDGGTGNDTIMGLSGDDVISGGAGADSVLGGDGDDLLIGGRNLLSGSVDRLSGQAGNDTLVGSWGARMHGGSGNDTFDINDALEQQEEILADHAATLGTPFDESLFGETMVVRDFRLGFDRIALENADQVIFARVGDDTQIITREHSVTRDGVTFTVPAGRVLVTLQGVTRGTPDQILG